MTGWMARFPKLMAAMDSKDRALLSSFTGIGFAEFVHRWRAVHPEDFVGVHGQTPLVDIESNADLMIVNPPEEH